MSFQGFYKRRRGIQEHLETGRISLLDLGVHDFLCQRANPMVDNGSTFPPGTWFGSARSICALCPREADERGVRRSLQHLAELGWIKRWLTPGKHGNYPILVARLVVANSAGNEFQINAEATTDWKQPKLEPAASCPRRVRRAASIREQRSEKREESFAFAGKHLQLTGTQIETWREAFPGLDIMAAIKKADAWCVANPGRGPQKLHARFMHSWLDREKPSKGNGQGDSQGPRPVGAADPRRQVSPQSEAIYEKFQGAPQ